MAEMFGFDAFSPKEIAARVETIGVAKARLPLLSMFMLAMLAGAFIGLGGLYFVLVRSDPTLGFALGQVLGGLVFSLGLLLIVAAGFEHSIANMYFIPLAMLLRGVDGVGASAPALTPAGLVGNLVPVILGNVVGGSVLVALVYHVIYRRGAREGG